MEWKKLMCDSCGSSDVEFIKIGYKTMLKCTCCGSIYAINTTPAEDKAEKEYIQSIKNDAGSVITQIRCGDGFSYNAGPNDPLSRTWAFINKVYREEPLFMELINKFCKENYNAECTVQPYGNNKYVYMVKI